MKYLLVITLIFLSLNGFAQIPGLEQGQTYAVVVGISDYQDEDIPDLRFADKDALAFAGFLQSQAGGSLDEDHLKVLINEQATQAQFAAALDWLWEVAGEKDKAIIYFSGHGDVEKKSLTQPGFLLCWDAPSRVYMAGGAFPLSMMQEVISTISIQNKAKVIMVADACRSGKLSGSKVGGAQLTNSNLAKQYANEIKILSCQPDEYSIEGEQWGGGRGAFSYHLLDGLYGMADGDEDLNVNLKEISRYLEDKVSSQVEPHNQNPVTVGSKTEKLTQVFPDLLAQIHESKKGQLQLFTPTESRGIEDDVLVAVDSNIVELYLAFKESLANKNFLCDSTEICADRYYEKLSREPQLEKLHSSMRRNYAAALQDDAQQVMNQLLESNPWEVNKTYLSRYKNYRFYPQLIRRAAALLGEDHYMFNRLMARSYWFEGYINDGSTCTCVDSLNGFKTIPYFRKALEYQPYMPHAWYQLAKVYGIQLANMDSMEYYVNRTIDAVPSWTAAYYWPAYVYNTHIYSGSTFTLGKTNNENIYKARNWLDRGLAVDSNSVLLLSESGDLYSRSGEFAKAESALNRASQIEPIASIFIYHTTNYGRWEKYEEGEAALLRAVELDSTIFFQSFYGDYHWEFGRDDKVKAWMRRLIDMDLKVPGTYFRIGASYSAWTPEESLSMLYKEIKLDSSNAMAYFQAAFAHACSPAIDTVEELRLVQQAVELAPEMPIYHVGEGLCYLRQNHFEKAKEKFLFASTLELPTSYGMFRGYVPNGLFMLYFQHGLKAEAEKILREAMASNPERFLAWLSLNARRYLHRPSTTNNCFESIKALYPDQPLVEYYHAVHLCFEEKNIDGAFAELENAFQKGFDDFGLLSSEYRFRKLRLQRDRWKTLMQKYFPDQSKN